MAAIDDIKSGLDINQVAALLGTDTATADQAVNQALGSLLGAMEGNVARDEDALGLARAALGDHDNDLLDGGVDLDAVDTADGDAILHHVYSPQQIQSLGGTAQGSLLQKLLPILAPIVMAYIAKRLGGYASGGQGGGILGDLLGGVLGGSQPTQRQQPADQGSGSILGDLLGGLFGESSPAADPTPAQAPRQQTTSGPVNTGSATGGLRMDAGAGGVPTVDPSRGNAQAQPPASGGIGDLLRQILVGR